MVGYMDRQPHEPFYLEPHYPVTSSKTELVVYLLSLGRFAMWRYKTSVLFRVVLIGVVGNRRSLGNIHHASCYG